MNTWSAPQRLDDDPGTTTAQLNPTVAFTASETMLAWRDNRLSANGDTQAGRFVFLPGLTDHFALTYDGLNRLKAVNGPVSESFTLDQASNVSNRSGTTETYDAANRLTQDGSTVTTWWDADRLKTRGTDTFNYDALDRLKDSTIAGTTRTYAYNGDGLLQSRIQGTATQFLWDSSSSPSRLLKQGSDNIVYGLGPLYVVRADLTTLTFARDGSKNVRAEVSSSGAVTASFRYRAYGQLAQSSSTGPTYLGLASQLLDPSGLYYMRARWYDATTGRFMTRDPLRGRPTAPASLNAFGYASGNPTNRTDPSGLCDIDDGTGGSSLAGCDGGEEGLFTGGAPVSGFAVGESDLAVGLRSASGRSAVNPTGGTLNCVNCAVAGDATLAGRPAVALPGEPVSIPATEGIFANTFRVGLNQQEISQMMVQAGPGARGIVYVYNAGDDLAHVFNAVNQGGVVRFIDFQAGTGASFEGYTDIWFLWTNVP